MSNIVDFPYDPDGLPRTHDDANARLVEVRTIYAEEAHGDIVEHLLSTMHNYGFRLGGDEESQKDIVFISEAIRAAIYRACSLNHYMHETIDQVVDLNNTKLPDDEDKVAAEQDS